MKVQKRKVCLMIVTLLLIVLVLFSMMLTYSKYSGLNVINSSAKIASWDFNVSVDGITKNTVDLASTYDENTLVNGKIAPGTKGRFTLSLDGTGSDVGINYRVEFSNEQNHPTNLLYKYGDIQTNNITELESALQGSIDATDTNKVRNLTIEWEWPYETDNDDGILANDRLDTDAGMYAANYILNVSVTAQQVLPK